MVRVGPGPTWVLDALGISVGMVRVGSGVGVGTELAVGAGVSVGSA